MTTTNNLENRIRYDISTGDIPTVLKYFEALQSSFDRASTTRRFGGNTEKHSLSWMIGAIMHFNFPPKEELNSTNGFVRMDSLQLEDYMLDADSLVQICGHISFIGEYHTGTSARVTSTGEAGLIRRQGRLE